MTTVTFSLAFSQHSGSSWDAPTSEREIRRAIKKNGMERLSTKIANMDGRDRKRKGDDIRIRIEPKTTKERIGWSAVASRSCCDNGGSRGDSRRVWAKLQMKTALPPIWNRGSVEGWKTNSKRTDRPKVTT
jgi:hypothetical protein